MKKLMLLGGGHSLLPVIEAAHELGYSTVTCDTWPENFAHRYSDEYCRVSIFDKEGVRAAAEELKVDGIMSFACDGGVVPAAYAAEKLGLPGQPYESVKILQNKARFRRFLLDNGFNVPKAKGYTDIASARSELEDFNWPLMVKPVDSAGSRGVTRIDSPEQLEDAASRALLYSNTGSFILEEFIQQQGCASDSDCFSVDGCLVYASFSNQMFDKKAPNPYVPSGFSWPSYMPKYVQNELREELQRLITLLGLNTAIYNVETRQSVNGKAYIMEVTPRGGGNRLAEILRLASGTDLITNAVRAAMGESVQDIAGDPVYDGNWAQIILHAHADGYFDSVQIAPLIRPCVVEEKLWIEPGAKISTEIDPSRAVGSLVLRFASREEMNERMAGFSELAKVVVI